MAVRREDTAPNLKDFQIGCSWVPTTPAKPNPSKEQLICTNWQQNHSIQANWLESERYTAANLVAQANLSESGILQQDFLQGTQSQTAPACCSSTNLINLSRDYNTWQASEVTNARVCGDNYWANMSFQKLLALAHARGNKAAVQNGVTKTDVAASGNSALRFHPQIEGGQFMISFANPSVQELESLRGAKSEIELNRPNVFTDGSSIPSGSFFHLNSPTREIMYADSSKTTPQFQPITPEKNNEAVYGQEPGRRVLSIDRATAGKDAQENKLTKYGSVELPENEEKSQLTIAATSTRLQENHKPDKGGVEEVDLSQTPQQKPRRKKHRPKVITEGQHKRTPKSSVDKPTVPQETTRVKRKYVRRKGVNSHLEGPTDGTDSNKKGPSPMDSSVSKRKYVRKGINKPQSNTDSGTTETSDAMPPRHTRSSCRRSLNFNSEGQVKDESSSNCPSSNCNIELQAEDFIAKDQSGGNEQGRMEKSDKGIYDQCTHSMKQVWEECMESPEQHFRSPAPSTTVYQLQDNHMFTDQVVCTRGKCQIIFSDLTHDKEANTAQIRMNPDDQRARNNLCDSINHTCLAPERQERVLKRQKMATTVEPELCNQNETGTAYNSLQKYLQIFSQNVDESGNTPGLNFPAIYKKKRSEVVHSIVPSSLQHTTSAIDSHIKFERHTPRDSCTNLFTSTHVTDGAQNGRQIFEALLALGPTEKIKKRRSKGPTRLRDLASLVEICKELPASPGRVATTSRNEQGIEILHEPHTCIEALVADTRSTVTTKKRSKRSMLVSSTVQLNQQKSSSISIGPPLALTWKCISPIDSITEQLNQLDLNAKSSQRLAQKQNTLVAYHTYYQEQQALVPFQGGAVVAFDGSFDQVRRRRPRPKVDLDDETTRVWKLLLENINSEGINGTDEQKTKWWEEERRVFNGRADSFIARMHLVQGDRRFSPWKGSVVDSVVGVFLTQNVSDHLSSSAFMSLAARFPAESRNCPVDLYEERLGTNIEPEAHEMDPDGTFGLNKEIFNLSVYGENIKKHQDFKDDSIREVNSVNSSRNSFDVFISEESLTGQLADFSEIGPVMPRETVANKLVSLVEDGKDTEDTLSSQNSADSPLAQTTERSDSCLPNTSEEPITQPRPDRFTSTTSFVKLLQMAGTVLHGVYDKSNDERVSDQNRRGQSESMAINLQNEGHLDYATFTAKPTSSYMSNLGGLKTECNLPHKTSKIFNSSSEKEPYGAEISGLTSESASQTTFQKITAVGFQEGPKFSSPNAQLTNNDQCEINRTGEVPAVSLYQENNIIMQELNSIYPENMDIVGISSNIDNSKSSEHKEVNSNKVDPDYPTGKKIDRLKAKGVRSRKEKEKQVDWDHLRKQACVGGREKAKAANMMDSVDWDAVRCADVNEIAQTIKERGMNNMLAERIKDFLNRLVREHGSVDLEWLRDVPPDKAKEYLLSIRGLGLKSVECVRLLTLHHLAFPVDTNVGRIAVRLGWVPLQPLPESLQLHLLELYPVLESIQKYLWPRLCKLDQRTLYELHYQMITFGKVFCTKSKPNCNACPMRGECRHFASAFASARLALPAPEEKSIVIAPEKREADQYTMRSMNNLQLPPPHTNQMDSKSGVSNSQPIIEEPATPEAIIEAPATPEPTYTQISECDIESTFNEEPDEIPTIQLNLEEFTNNLQKIIEQSNELQESDMSKALVALTSEAASIPVPKLKNVSRLRTEHQVYELPDSHPLLEGMDKREPDDPCPYLLSIWTPGETVDSIEPPERQCSSQGSEKLCPSETCSSCNSIREANSQTVRGTLLIPCRTAMRGSFPLNGTYFQVNEVFSDHESSLSPMDVPRGWLWKLPRRTVYFGTSIPTIFKGLSTEGIQYCFWRGFVCVRGFDRKTRAPRPLAARLHFPTSKLGKGERKDR